jgi:hypothetical protein
VLEERTAALVPLLRLLGESAREDGVELGVGDEGRRLLLHVRPQRLCLRVVPERGRSREALVEDTSECVLVGAAVDLAAPDLLGRDVVE